MARRSMAVAWTFLVLGLCAGVAPQAPAGGEAPRMTKEELKPLLGSSDVVVIDVRIGGDQAPTRIPGSVYESAADIDSWAGKYPKGKRIVLYCA